MQRERLEELAKAIRAALEHDERVNLHRSPIHVKVEDELIVLEGEAEDICTKRTAARIAHQVAEEAPVADRVRLIPAERPEKHDEIDGRIRDEVVTAFMDEPVFRDHDLFVVEKGERRRLRDLTPEDGEITLAVDHGVVTLEGKVRSLTHRRLAEVLAWWTAGVVQVENHLQVVPPEEENDGELADAIEMILERDPMIHRDNLIVTVKDHTVRVTGSVASPEEKALVLRDLCYIPGVHEIEDAIEVRH